MEKKPSTPFVHWAQSAEQLFLRIELEAKSTPIVSTTAKHFQFSCRGTAPTLGTRDYEVALDLHGEIVPGPSGFRMEIRGSSIEFFIEKAEDQLEFWPNLLKDRAKPAWLKLDFNRFQSGEPDSEEEKENKDGDRPMRDTVDQLLRDTKRPTVVQGPLDFKKMYLTAYNTFMLLGFAGVLSTIFREYCSEGSDSISGTYEHVGLNMRIVQGAQFLEFFHALLGLVKSAPRTAFAQSAGRSVVLALIHGQPKIQNTPLVFWLFIVWSLIEVIRYPYYLCQIHEVVPKPLKVLRYTAWVVLYPAGMILETLVIIRAIETYPYSHWEPLAEVGGLKITVTHIIGTYLCLCPFGFILMLRHMFAQTKSQLFGDSQKTRYSKTKKVK